jgi:MraZ protein
MLIGEFTHVLDDKKRISLPSKFRKEIGNKIVVTYGLDKCLWLFPVKAWQQLSSKLANLGLGHADNRQFTRAMFGGAGEIEVDSAGRILLPEYLCDHAGLRAKVVFVGIHDRVELWNEKEWQLHKKRALGKADQLAEKLGTLGSL